MHQPILMNDLLPIRNRMLRILPPLPFDRIGRSSYRTFLAVVLASAPASAQGPPAPGGSLLRVADSEPVLSPIDHSELVVPRRELPTERDRPTRVAVPRLTTAGSAAAESPAVAVPSPQSSAERIATADQPNARGDGWEARGGAAPPESEHPEQSDAGEILELDAPEALGATTVEDPGDNEPRGPIGPLNADLQMWSDLAGELPAEVPEELPAEEPPQSLGAGTSGPLPTRHPRDLTPDEPAAAETETTPGDLLPRAGNDSGTLESGEQAALPPQSPAPASPRPEIRPEAAALQGSLASCLQHYYHQYEDMGRRSPWGTFHAMLPFGTDARVRQGRRTYNAIAWLSGNNPCRNQRLLTVRSGRVQALTGVGLQGHQAQLLAMLAQTGVPVDYPLYAYQRKFSIADLVESEQLACRAGEELTFTLIGLSHYLSTDDAWRSSDGQRWDFPRLLEEELRQPVVGAACGGTHRLMGLSYALRQRRAEGLPIEGQWRRAEIYIEDFIAYAWSLQNPDGSMSTEWFEARGDNGDLDRKFQTTGHMLEWLVFTAQPAELQDDRFVRAVRFLVTAMNRHRTKEWAVGPRGHALRALSLYHAKVFGDARPWASSTVAHGATAPRR